MLPSDASGTKHTIWRGSMIAIRFDLLAPASMAPTTYLAPPRPMSLYAVLDASTSMSPMPTLDLDWEPFQAHVEAFLNAVREREGLPKFDRNSTRLTTWTEERADRNA